MPRPAKEIPEKFKLEIEQYGKQGYSNNWIAKHCKDCGFDIDARVIGRYLDKVGIEQSGKKVTYDKTLHSENSNKQDDQVSDPIVVNINELFKRFKISDDLSNISNIVDATQKMTAQIFLLEAAILYTRLEIHARGECKHPSDQFRGYRIASEVMKASWGYQQCVSLSSAMKTLEAEGYEVQAMRLIEENGSN